MVKVPIYKKPWALSNRFLNCIRRCILIFKILSSNFSSNLLLKVQIGIFNYVTGSISSTLRFRCDSHFHSIQFEFWLVENSAESCSHCVGVEHRLLIKMVSFISSFSQCKPMIKQADTHASIENVLCIIWLITEMREYDNWKSRVYKFQCSSEPTLMHSRLYCRMCQYFNLW